MFLTEYHKTKNFAGKHQSKAKGFKIKSFLQFLRRNLHTKQLTYEEINLAYLHESNAPFTMTPKHYRTRWAPRKHGAVFCPNMDSAITHYIFLL